MKIVKASLLALALPLLGAVPAYSQSHPNFLWSVETPTNTVYLLGSIHLLTAEDYPLSQSIQAAFAEAETVVFEVDIDTLQSPDTTSIVLERALPDSDAERLQTALTPEQYVLAEAAAAEVGLPLVSFNHFEPWFFSITLTSLKLLQLGLSAEYGIDRYLFQQAVEANKEIMALETLAEQMDVFDHLSLETQQALVAQTLGELDLLESSFEIMRAAWQVGDVETLESFILDELEPYPELQTALFTQRNQNWLVDIHRMLNQEQDYLVVVGAGHLVGEMGLVQQLQLSGYTVEQR